jgi:hypothetical protein
MHDVNSTCRQNKLHHEHSAWYLKLIEPFEWRDDPNLVSHDARSARVSCFLVFSFGAARLAASSSCPLLNNHWSLCTPKAHIYLKVILVQLNSWESRCLSLPLVAVGQYMLSRILSRTRIITIIIDQKSKFSFLTPWQKDQKQSQRPKLPLTHHNYYSRTIIPNHKSFPNENKQKTKFISLISKYSRTHTITTSVFERDIPLDLWRSLKGCKKDIWRYPQGSISTVFRD